jgi:ectoine hydroxylase
MLVQSLPDIIGTERDIYPTRKNTEPALLDRKDPVVWGEVTDGPIDSATLASYEENGFLAVRELLTSDEVNHYLEELRRVLANAAIRSDDRTAIEPDSSEIRSIYEIHKVSEAFAELIRDPRLVGRARQILGSEVYVHQTRVNFKPGYGGEGFYWHSDFETWHSEDGMPRPRAVSISVALTENYPYNGPLLIIPGSHKTFVSCVGETPENNYRSSLRNQEIGLPDAHSLAVLTEKHRIEQFDGPIGSATIFDCNCMHGSSDNITPFPRINVFMVFNSVDNALVEPFAAPSPRPTFLGARDFTPVR